MLLEPFANACGSTLVRVRRRMRAMKDTHFAKQNDGDPASLPLADFRAQFAKQSLDVVPLDVRACGVREDRGQRTHGACASCMRWYYEQVPARNGFGRLTADVGARTDSRYASVLPARRGAGFPRIAPLDDAEPSRSASFPVTYLWSTLAISV